MISVPFAAGSNATRIPFPDQPQLRDVLLQGLEFTPIAKDYYGKTTLNTNATYLNAGYVTLYFDGKTGIQTMPLQELVSIMPSGVLVANVNGLVSFAGQRIVWPKCFITLPAPTPPGADSVFMFGVYYSMP
jgi:hypothetical protein